MKISKPEKAIGAFEQALRKNPADAALASRVGKVLVTTHEYVKAIEYYSTAFQKDASKQVRAGAPRTRRRVGGWGHHARVRARERVRKGAVGGALRDVDGHTHVLRESDWEQGRKERFKPLRAVHTVGVAHAPVFEHGRSLEQTFRLVVWRMVAAIIQPE